MSKTRRKTLAWSNALIITGAIAISVAIAIYRKTETPIRSSEQTPIQKPAEKISGHKDSIQVVAPHPAIRALPSNSERLAFIRTHRGRFEASTQLARAVVNSSGELIFSAKIAPPSVPNDLTLRLKGIKRGESSLYDRAVRANLPDSAIDTSDGGVGFWRAPNIEERYFARADGVQLNFLIRELPHGNGDLEFTNDMIFRHIRPVPHQLNRNGGIVFLDVKGNFVARFGQAVARDSNMQGIAVEPRMLESGQSLSVSIPSAWLVSAAYPVTVEILLGGDFPISGINLPGVGAPTISAGNGNFLVVWNDFADGQNAPRIRGSVISSTGNTSGDFGISPPSGQPRSYRYHRIAAAFDGASWLVVWSDDRRVGPGVRGAIVDSRGNVQGGSDFLIAPTPGLVREDPLVAFNGTDYLVAWQNIPEAAPVGSQIYVTRVSTAGAISAPEVLHPEDSPSNQTLLFLTPQKPSGDTLLLYREKMEGAARIRAARIAPDGTLRDPSGISIFEESNVLSGQVRPIGSAFVTGLNMVGGLFPQWHILSANRNGIDLYKLDLNGVVTPPAGVFIEPGWDTSQEINAYPGSNEWLLVATTGAHLIGKRVTYEGFDKDPVSFQIDTALSDLPETGSTMTEQKGAVAAQAENMFLVAWADTRPGVNVSSSPSSSPIEGPGVDGKTIAASLIAETTGRVPTSAMVAVATASPLNGDAPLTVSFDASASLGLGDSVYWNFGDGTGSSDVQVWHTYKNNGIFLAQLQLTKGGASVYDSLLVNVGEAGSGRAPCVGVPINGSVKDGKSAHGTLRITAFVAKESHFGIAPRTHSFSIKGRLVVYPGTESVRIEPAGDGELVLFLGDFVVSLPVTECKINDNHMTYMNSTGNSCVNWFLLDTQTGRFNLEMQNVPAAGLGGGHLPFAAHGKNWQNVNAVNFNFSLQFRLSGHDKFMAGRCFHLERDADQGWKLR